MAKDKATKALEMLKTNKSVSERADSYAASIKRNIQRDVIDNLVAKKEAIEDQLFELSDFTLETNINNGRQALTKDDCEKRFKKIIELEYNLKLIDLELTAKTESFNKLFGND